MITTLIIAAAVAGQPFDFAADIDPRIGMHAFRMAEFDVTAEPVGIFGSCSTWTDDLHAEAHDFEILVRDTANPVAPRHRVYEGESRVDTVLGIGDGIHMSPMATPGLGIQFQVYDWRIIGGPFRIRLREGEHYDLRYDTGSCLLTGETTIEHLSYHPPGDVTLDGVFNSTDLVSLFAAGTYNGGRIFDLPMLDRWQLGEFDRLAVEWAMAAEDGFTSSDLVLALQVGSYSTAATAVTEPVTCFPFLAALLALVFRSHPFSLKEHCNEQSK